MAGDRARTFPLAPDGIFWTLQGEGALSGEPMAFVRLAGCSIGCAECDTDYRVARRLDIEAILREVQSVVPPGFSWPWVWITGGEPTDHHLAPLIDALHTIKCRVALATAGTRQLPVSPRVEWLSVSPHGLMQTVVRMGHELKIVPGLNGLSWADIETEIVRWSFPWRFLQPRWGTSTEACVDFVKTHPGWRISLQAHKYLGLP
jgi:7-carboxy-7-deazaguanine synthase